MSHEIKRYKADSPAQSEYVNNSALLFSTPENELIHKPATTLQRRLMVSQSYNQNLLGSFRFWEEILMIQAEIQAREEQLSKALKPAEQIEFYQQDAFLGDLQGLIRAHQPTHPDNINLILFYEAIKEHYLKNPRLLKHLLN